MAEPTRLVNIAEGTIRVSTPPGSGISFLGLYSAAFRASPRTDHDALVDLGVIVGGIAGTILQALGGNGIGHDLKRARTPPTQRSAFLGLIAWAYLGAAITLYSAENNTVLFHSC